MNHIDDRLRNRYEVLFSLYGVGADPMVIQIKEMLADWVRYHEGQLRADAIHFLLVNFDQLIIRPYAGFVPEPRSEKQPYGLSMPSFRDRRDFLPTIERALNLVLEDVKEKNAPVSAHEVMKTIDKNWDRLRELFGWG